MISPLVEIEERVEREAVSVETGVVPPEDIAEGLVARTIAHDVLSGLQDRISDFV